MRSAWDRGAVGKWTGMEMGLKASKRWDGDATAAAAACRALCGQLPDGQIKELVIVIPLQSPSKWGNYRCSPPPPALPPASCRVNILLLIYNAGRTHYPKVSVEWWTLGEHVRLGSCRAQATGKGTGSGDAKANLCWRSVFGGVRQCVSTINLITTRFSRLDLGLLNSTRTRSACAVWQVERRWQHALTSS